MNSNKNLIINGYNSLCSHWPMALLITISTTIFVSLVPNLPSVIITKYDSISYGSVLPIILLLPLAPLNIDFHAFFLNLVNGSETDFKDLLSGFKQNYLQINAI